MILHTIWSMTKLTMFMQIERKLKKIIAILVTFTYFSGKGPHTQHYDTLGEVLECEFNLCFIRINAVKSSYHNIHLIHCT